MGGVAYQFDFLFHFAGKSNQKETSVVYQRIILGSRGQENIETLNNPQYTNLRSTNLLFCYLFCDAQKGGASF